jgi:GNAT superfamily N-acetyltransferase
VNFVADVFAVDATPLLRIGHDPETVTFGWWQGDDLVANISLYPRQLCLAGAEVPALGIQSVGARAAHRRQGLFTDLIQKVLAYADARSCPIVFATDKPDLYLRWGFRRVAECAFATRVQPSARKPRYRRLAIDQDADIALIKARFADRAPASLIASTRDHVSAFFMRVLVMPWIEVLHLPDLDAIVAVEGREGPEMALLDVIAPAIPPLQDIVCALGCGKTRVILHLTPDLLCPDCDQIPCPYPTPLMVRGRFVADGVPMMLSRMRI